MELIETGIAVVIFLGIGAYGIYQARKTRSFQREYNKLSDVDKDHLDKTAWDEPKLFAYSKPMNKSMWASSIIAVVFLVWVFLENATS
jgi:hypothetical protein